MKKLVLLAAVAVATIGSAFSQALAIPGEIFAENPTRFNGRKVTVKNIEILKPTEGDHAVSIGGPVNVTPGPVGVSGPTSMLPCRTPRGFSSVEIFFKGATNFKACFFMADNMREQMYRETGHESTPAEITFRGDSRTGYMVSFYRLGS